MKTYEEMNTKEVNFKLSMPLDKEGRLILGNSSKLDSNVKSRIELENVSDIPVNEFYYIGSSLVVVKIDDYIKVLKHFKGDMYIPCEIIYLGMNTVKQIKNIITTLDKKSIDQMKHWLNDYNSIVDVSPKYSIYELHKIIDDINYLKAI